MLRRLTTLLACIAAAMLFTVPAVYAEKEIFDKADDVSPGTRFKILNRNGGIEIAVWDNRQIAIHAVKKTRWGGKLENVAIDVVPGMDFRVETIHVVKNPKVSVRYVIKVPFDVLVKSVRTSNGEIDLNGTRGDAEIGTSNGSIEVEGVQGDIEASTSNGAIEIEDVSGSVIARTSNGAISVERAAGVHALETSNGAIEAEVRGVGGDGARLRTSNGAIELKIDPGLNIELDAKTSNGKITVQGLELMVMEVSKTTLKGRLGAGGKRVTCRTSNGGIELEGLE